MSTSSATVSTVKVTVNGEAKEVPVGTTLMELLRTVGREPEQSGVAVAVEGEVVRREDWDGTTLAGGEKIEIVTAQQGG